MPRPPTEPCLTGSANCSQVALWHTHPDANVELGNLLTGARDAFDHLLRSAVVQVTGPVDPTTPDVIQDDDATHPRSDVRMEALCWVAPHLTGQLYGPMDDGDELVIELDGLPISAQLHATAGSDGVITFVATITDPDNLHALEGVPRSRSASTPAVAVGDRAAAVRRQRKGCSPRWRRYRVCSW